MQSLRDQLLKAGLVSREQADKAEASRNKGSRRGGEPRDRRPPVSAAGPAGKGGASSPAQPARPAGKPQGKKAPERPVRLLDLSDPARLRILQAIESNRVREETRGEEQFFFPLRDGRVRKLFVNGETLARLEAGQLAIVENGDLEQHTLVRAEAVADIRAVDPEAVRFHNES